MTDEQINAAIAEACAWGQKPVVCTNEKGAVWVTTYPNYVGDLNAMHEAEKVFDCPELYECNLIKVCGGIQYMWHATARQRAKTFLLTLGKWSATDKESLTVQTATTEQFSVDHLRDATKMMEAQP